MTLKTVLIYDKNITKSAIKRNDVLNSNIQWFAPNLWPARQFHNHLRPVKFQQWILSNFLHSACCKYMTIINSNDARMFFIQLFQSTNGKRAFMMLHKCTFHRKNFEYLSTITCGMQRRVLHIKILMSASIVKSTKSLINIAKCDI